MRRLAGLVLCGALLAGCGGAELTPKGRLQDLTAELVQEANAKDLAGVRGAAADLRQEVEDQVRAGLLSRARGQLLLQLLAAIERDALLLIATPTPSATPSPTPSPTASPTPSPTASPTPSPTPSESPTPSPTPSPTQTVASLLPSSPQPSASP